MEIRVNGERREVAATDVAGLVRELGFPDRGIAVAIGDEVVPRSRWDRALEAGAEIEILTAVQGG